MEPCDNLSGNNIFLKTEKTFESADNGRFVDN